MTIAYRLFIFSVTALLVTACATGPKYDTSSIDLDITPLQAVNDSERLRGQRVLWGGIIIASDNLKAVTQFEILAYPLDSNQRPQTDKAPLGRFIAQHQGYVETADYTQGRLMTVSGLLQGTSTGRIGESEYSYPLVDIDNLYLWAARDDRPETSVHFGIGVQIHN